MTVSFSQASKVLQNFDTSVTYVEQFDLSPCCIWDDEAGVCVSSEGMNILLSNMARMGGQGWTYMYLTQDEHDEAIFRLHYQSSFS